MDDRETRKKRPVRGAHRKAIVSTAVRLFRQQGYAATGLAQIVAESGAPKGSVYHYFPAGKAQIGAEAIAEAGRTVETTLLELEAVTDGPAELMTRYLTLLGGWMEQSGFRDGSPITTTLLETAPDDPSMTDAGAAAFAAWSAVIERSAVDAGVAADRAAELARFALFAVEGALVHSRVTRDSRPFEVAADQFAALVAAHPIDADRP